MLFFGSQGYDWKSDLEKLIVFKSLGEKFSVIRSKNP